MKRPCLFAWATLTMLCASAAVAGPVHPGKTGNELEALVRGSHSPTTNLTYREGREALYDGVDNEGDVVRLIYTGELFPNPGKTIPDHTVVNTEHVWPQSRFGNSAKSKKKSDLHHIFPCRSRVNSARGNNPFGLISAGSGVKFWDGPNSVSGVPGSNVHRFSKSKNGLFEPRRDDKGNVARAMFYFRAVYGNTDIDKPFFNAQRQMLLDWHRDDPVDATEEARNKAVEDEQGNLNPFIEDDTLAERMFGSNPTVRVPSDTGTAPPAGDDAVLVDGEEIDIMTWNLEWFFDADTGDNSSDLAERMSADNAAEFGERVREAALVIKNSGMPEIVALQEIENKRVVEQLATELNEKHGANYKVGFVQGTDTFTEQDVAYLYEGRPLEVEFQRIPRAGFTNRTLHKVPSKHCVMTITHRLADGRTQQLMLINCHLKAGRDAEDEAQRKKQGRVMSGFVKNTLTVNPAVGVVVLGDMNAGKRFQDTSEADGMGVLRGMETRDPLEDLMDVNVNLSPAKRKTHVSNRELDRILLSGALLDDVGLVFEQVVVRKDLIDDESDHFPMIATFIYRETPQP